MARNDGGPAFPTTIPPIEEGAVAGVLPGLSARDWFAGRAMQGIVSSIDSEANYQRLQGHAAAEGLKVSGWIARDAYKQADAMLKEREKPHA